MKKITAISIISLLAIILGAILMMGGNKGGDYLTVIGAILGMYTCYLMDKEALKNPENQL